METTQIEARAQEFIDALHALEQGSIDDASRLVMLYAEQAQLHNSRSTTRHSRCREPMKSRVSGFI
jgi:hypothetical protein